MAILSWSLETQIDWHYIAPGKPTQNAFIESFKRNVTGTRFTADKQAWFTMDRDLEAEHDGREPQCEDEGAQCDDEGAEVRAS